MGAEVISREPSVKILYVEDDLGLARLLRKKLTRHGYDVELAFSGEDGLRMLDEQAFDVLLLDHNLPGMSGLDVIENLRAEKKLIPVIMITANGSELVAVEAMKRGASDYLVKDSELIFLQLLPVILEKLLNQQRMLRECHWFMERVREHEDRYRRVMEGTSDGILVSLGGLIEVVNPAGAFLLGLDRPEQGIGRGLDEFFLGDESGALPGGRSLQPGEAWSSLECARRQLRQPNGRVLEFWVREVSFQYQGQQALMTFIFPAEN